MDITYAPFSTPDAGVLVVGASEERQLTALAAELDRAMDGALQKAMDAGRFKGKRKDSLSLLAPRGLGVHRLILVGLGKPDGLDELALQTLGGDIAAQLIGAGERDATVALQIPAGAPVAAGRAAALVAQGLRLRAYRFDKYKTKEKEQEDRKPFLEAVTVLTDDVAAAQAADGALAALADGVAFTRDLVSEPANILYPETLAARCEELTALGVSVEVFDEEAMRKLGMGSLLGVGQGSERESRMVVMRWQGAADDAQAPLAFIGKGVTFDTGGISIKPAGGMEDMKWDMGGSGVVIGLMKALAGRKAKVNVVGLVGLVENMPSGNAQRPGDVVTSMSGQTIEVINTDAEGRLVLADVLWYCQDRFHPRFMIDLATLTGAIIVSLGHENAGMFSNDDELADRLLAAGTAVGEPVWRMPLGESYDKEIDSDIADMKNVSAGRAGGSITAAQFLQRFVNNHPWAHLDIAGVTWAKKDKSLWPKGGSGFGVRLLDKLVADHYEA